MRHSLAPDTAPGTRPEPWDTARRRRPRARTAAKPTVRHHRDRAPTAGTSSRPPTEAITCPSRTAAHNPAGGGLQHRPLAATAGAGRAPASLPADGRGIPRVEGGRSTSRHDGTPLAGDRWSCREVRAVETGRDLAAVLRSLQPATGDRRLVGADPNLCAQLLGVDGIAACVTTADGQSEPLWCTEGTSTRLEDLQFTLGQGPGPEVMVSCAPVLVPDLSRVAASRWPALLPEATALGIGAVFCLPLHVGSACLGTLTLQRAAPGPLPDATLTDAWLVANALTAVFLHGGPQQEAFARADSGSELYRAVVHQATGMISVQARVPLARALLLLRGYAYGHRQSVVEAAEDVVARRLRFHNDEKGPETSGEGTDGP
ncbi:hypothetical protein DMH18_36190 [Streptomyces sp. WAC 06783]|nr:hypothetical protein DMH18_36190 [Streptomyces sp. WAC 06783]